MTRKCQKNTDQSQHREEETQNTDTQMTAITQPKLSHQLSLSLSLSLPLSLSLSHRDQCQTGKEIKSQSKCLKQNPHRQWDKIHRTRTEVTEATGDGEGWVGA